MNDERPVEEIAEHMDEMWDTLINCLKSNGVTVEKPKDIEK